MAAPPAAPSSTSPALAMALLAAAPGLLPGFCLYCRPSCVMRAWCVCVSGRGRELSFRTKETSWRAA